MMIFLFWASIILLIHTYIFYPFSLSIITRIRSKKLSQKLDEETRISLLVAVYNEEAIIEEKIKNSLELDYPHKNLEILFGSDCSTDNSDNIIKKHLKNNIIHFFRFNKRKGKAAVLNQLVPHATGDIILFCDANTMLLKNTVKKIVSNFSHPDVGCVCGRLVLKDASGTSLGQGESVYWKLESELKKIEGRLGVVIGANGGIYAIRRFLFKKLPEEKMIMDDFFITTRVLLKGKKAVFEPLAIGHEETSLDQFGEFRRKVRIGQANFNYLFQYIKLLNPKLGMVAYSFLSHKLLRWLGPVLILTTLFSNFIISVTDPNNMFIFLTLLGQICVYILAVIGYLLNRFHTKPIFIFALPFYFFSMNIALFWGMIKAIFSRKGGMWERVERSYSFNEN